MSKITEEQKLKFYELYKKGYRSRPISRETGMDRSYTLLILHQFDSGDFSWLNTDYHHHEKAISEKQRQRIAEELSESSMSWVEAVSKYGFPENTLRMWKRNYNEYGVCSRKRGRPRKGGSDGNERNSRNQAAREREEITARRNYYLQNVLPCLRGKRDGSAKKRLYERLANAEDLESLSSDALRCSD